jgi:hypothetical protein
VAALLLGRYGWYTVSGTLGRSTAKGADPADDVEAWWSSLVLRLEVEAVSSSPSSPPVVDPSFVRRASMASMAAISCEARGLLLVGATAPPAGSSAAEFPGETGTGPKSGRGGSTALLFEDGFPIVRLSFGTAGAFGVVEGLETIVVETGLTNGAPSETDK